MFYRCNVVLRSTRSSYYLRPVYIHPRHQELEQLPRVAPKLNNFFSRRLLMVTAILSSAAHDEALTTSDWRLGRKGLTPRAARVGVPNRNGGAKPRSLIGNRRFRTRDMMNYIILEHLACVCARSSSNREGRAKLRSIVDHHRRRTWHTTWCYVIRPHSRQRSNFSKTP